jgi:mono/diheme cytochrome c family protein
VTRDIVTSSEGRHTLSRGLTAVMRKPSSIVGLLAFILVLGWITLAATQEKIKPPYHDLNLAALAGTVSGADLYKQLCAGCHGADAKGVGPTSPYCPVPPTDLTLLTKKNYGAFPEQKVTQILRYGTEKPNQSTTYMPVWKPLLSTIHGGSSELTEKRITSLTEYLVSIQPKPASK